MSRAFLFLCGLLYLGFGLWVLLSPEGGLAYLQTELNHVNALSDLRGSHGGLNVAVGLFLLYSATAPDWHRYGLLLVGLLNVGYLGGRLVALLADGPPDGMVQAAMVLELVLSVVAFVLAGRTRPQALRA
ncbi:MAG: DUF4345 domain-containing protein [Gammaproteobacteria bacterium]